MYYLVFGLLYGISLLPFTLLYLLSDFLYFLTYYVVGYRKAVLMKNLGIAFPELEPAARVRLAKTSYKRFWDNWIESIKLLSMSGETLKRRVTVDIGPLESLYDQNSNCHVLLGHQFNWEWSNARVSLETRYKVLCAYAPQSKIIDRIFLRLRRRFGAVLLPFNDMRRAMLPFRNQRYLLALMADQSPPFPSKSYWPVYFGRKTAFLMGSTLR